MKKACVDELQRLAQIRARSLSDEEFWLKAIAEGILPGFWITTLFRLCLFRNNHPGLKWLEFIIIGLGIVGFSLWGGLIGPKNLFGAIGIMLLAVAVLAPLEILFILFEELCLKLLMLDIIQRTSVNSSF